MPLGRATSFTKLGNHVTRVPSKAGCSGQLCDAAARQVIGCNETTIFLAQETPTVLRDSKLGQICP